MFIRPELPGDAAAVRAVHEAAFAAQAPAGTTPPEAGLVDALRRAGDLVPALCLVAEVEGQVVGHVATSRTSQDGVVGVAPLGVLPAHQRGGIGSGLMHTLVGAAEALWYQGVVLLGDPGYYARFGFAPAAAHGLSSAHPEWPAGAFQVRPLPSSWPGAYPPGTVVRYAPAIEAL